MHMPAHRLRPCQRKQGLGLQKHLRSSPEAPRASQGLPMAPCACYGHLRSPLRAPEQLRGREPGTELRRLLQRLHVGVGCRHVL